MSVESEKPIGRLRSSLVVYPGSGKGLREAMPAPPRTPVQVVRCKECKRCVPVLVDTPSCSINVRCPVSLERRSYIASTEVFLRQPSWEVMRALQGRRA